MAGTCEVEEIFWLLRSLKSEPVGTSSNQNDFQSNRFFVDDDFQPWWTLKKSYRLLPRYFSIRVLDLNIRLMLILYDSNSMSHTIWPGKNKNLPQRHVYKLGHGIHWTVLNEDCLRDLLLGTCTRSKNIMFWKPEVTPDVPFYCSFDNFFDKYHIVPLLQVVLLWFDLVVLARKEFENSLKGNCLCWKDCSYSPSDWLIFWFFFSATLTILRMACTWKPEIFFLENK